MRFENKVVLVTGSGSGIEEATVILFAVEEADVIIVDINEETARKTAEKCRKFGRRGLVIKADVFKDQEARKAIEKTILDYGKLNVLVNSAGIVRKGNVLSGNIMETYDKVMNTNLCAVVLMTTLAAPYLMKTKGCIQQHIKVNISSIA